MVFGVDWEIMVGGEPASSRMNGYIESIEVSGHAGGKADSARLTFANKMGVLAAPPKNTPVSIIIGGRTRFGGFTDAPESVVSRGGGRTIEVNCSAIDKTSKVKQPMHLHKDDCTLKEFLEACAKQAGTTIKVDESLGAFKRPYWSTRKRNFLRTGQQLADDLGATFKSRGGVWVFAARGSGLVPGGGSTPTILATYGDTLIEARIRPYEGSDRWAKARTRHYDREQSKWLYEDVEIGDVTGGSDVRRLLGEDRPDSDYAKKSSGGGKTDSDREGGSGSVTILYNPDVEVEGKCIVVGVDVSSDGAYRIESYTDRLKRGVRSEQTLELKQPQGSEGGGSGENSGDSE